MKLTPSILTARESRFSSGSRESSLTRESSDAREASLFSAASLANPPRNRAPLVGASIKGSVIRAKKSLRLLFF